MSRQTSLILAVSLLVGFEAEASSSTSRPAEAQEPAVFLDAASCAQLEQSGLALKLRKVGLRHVSPGFANSHDVRCLSLEDNEIERVSPSALALLPNLLYLSLARNRLPPGSLARLDGHANLRTLVLDGNGELASLGLEGAFPSLASLSARACGLRDVGPLAFAPNLTRLDLSGNELSGSGLAFAEAGPAGLAVLELADTGIAGLDASRLASARELLLDGNRLRELCAGGCGDSGLALAGAARLRVLSAARNELTAVSADALRGAEGLERLDLSRNRLAGLGPGTFRASAALRNLTLRENRLAEVPDLCGARSLEHLSLASNLIRGLAGGSFCAIGTLKSIDLSNNSIEAVEPGTFANQTALESLDLSRNRLATLPDAWLDSLLSLRVLRVSDNRLSSLSDLALEAIKYRSKLEFVDLRNNSIAKFYMTTLFNVFKIIPYIEIVFVDESMLFQNLTVATSDAESCNCDCDENNEV